MFCSNCGKELPDTTKFCFHCGTPTSQFNRFSTAESSASTQLQQVYSAGETISETETGNKSFFVAMVLSMLPAPWGLHRIYTGKIVSGLIQFFTAGLYFIWSSIDVLLIVTNRFKDAQGKKLRGYNKGIAFVGLIVWLFAISGFIYAIAVTSGQPSNNHENRPQETVIPAETRSPEKKGHCVKKVA